MSVGTMRTPGTAKELEVRRRIGGKLLLQGYTPAEVARILDVSWTSAKRWQQAVVRGGLEALASKPHPGKPCRLTASQKRKLVSILLKGPLKAGFPTDLWTCRRVALVIQKNFGVSYHPDHVGKILHSLGWTCQKPEQRSRKRDEAAIERWRKKDWPRIKRNVKRGAIWC